MADGVAWETVRRAAGGDADARRSLVEATVDNVWALAMRLVRRRDDADEITQETYARLFAGIAGLTPTGRFEGYLARIATNLVLERWRRRRPTADLDGFDLSAADAMEPWQAVAKSEDEKRRLAAIWEAIGTWKASRARPSSSTTPRKSRAARSRVSWPCRSEPSRRGYTERETMCGRGPRPA